MDVGSNKSRKDTRAVVSLVARYRSPSTFEYVQEACCDVSVGGMFIKSADPAAAGTLLKLECEAHSGAEKIRGVARVVWLRRDANEYGPSGMGVKFVKLEPGSRETITRIVQELSAAGVEPQSMSSAPESRGKPPGVHAASARPAIPSAAQQALVPVAAMVADAAPAQAAEPAAPRRAAEAEVEADRVDMRTSAPPSPPLPERRISDTPPARDSYVQPQLVDAAPRSAVETRSSLPPSSRPPAAVPKPSGGLRIGWLVAVALAAVLVYLLAKRETHSQGDTTPAPAAEVVASPMPEPPPAAVPPPPAAAETTAPAEPAPAPANDSPTAEPAPAAPPTQAAPAAEQAKADTAQPTEAAPENKPAEPAADTTPDAPAASDPKPEAPAAADAKPPTAAERAASTPPSAAAPAQAAIPADRPPLANGQLPYVLSFITRPIGATVTVGEQTVVAPGDMDLGAMPPRVKVTAQKEGFENTSAWLDRQTEFVKSGNAMRRRVYLTLQPLKPGAEAPKR